MRQLLLPTDSLLVSKAQLRSRKNGIDRALCAYGNPRARPACSASKQMRSIVNRSDSAKLIEQNPVDAIYCGESGSEAGTDEIEFG